MIDVDLRKSKDKIPVLHYDKAFVRTCSHGRFSTDFNFNEIPPLLNQIKIEYALNDDKSDFYIYKA